MNFCGTCDNYLILRIKTDEGTGRQLMEHYCRNCGHSGNVNTKENKYIYKNDYNIQKLIIQEKNIQYLCDDPSLPRVSNIPCPNLECPTNSLHLKTGGGNSETSSIAEDEIGGGRSSPKNNLKGDVVYYMIDETNMKYVYLCCHCKNTWTNS